MNAEELHERLTKPAEPMSDEEIEYVIAQLEVECAKINRLANNILNRPQGISIHAQQTLDHIKSGVSWLRWHWQKNRLRGDDAKPETP